MGNESETEEGTPVDIFQAIQNGQQLLPILRQRLPRAANIYNMALMHENFLKEMKIYTINGDTSNNAWIVIIFEREDYGRDINVSAPFLDEHSVISDAVRTTFITSNLFNWNKPYFFTALDRPVSKMIFEISCHIRGNKTTVNPSAVYYCSDETKVELGSSNFADSTLKSLNSIQGINFIHDNWVYSKEGTKAYVQKIIKHNPSSGVFIENQVVSGVVTTANGFVGMLFTDRNWRNRNFGSLAMRNLLRQLMADNFIPCSVVEEHNKISKRFHQKLGMIISHHVDFIFNT